MTGGHCKHFSLEGEQAAKQAVPQNATLIPKTRLTTTTTTLDVVDQSPCHSSWIYFAWLANRNRFCLSTSHNWSQCICRDNNRQLRRLLLSAQKGKLHTCTASAQTYLCWDKARERAAPFSMSSCTDARDPFPRPSSISTGIDCWPSPTSIERKKHAGMRRQRCGGMLVC